MKASEILYRAAEVVEQSRVNSYAACCCGAIEEAASILKSRRSTAHIRAQRYLESIYKKDGYAATGWYGYWMGSLIEGNKELRIMALLFTATIAESIGD